MKNLTTQIQFFFVDQIRELFKKIIIICIQKKTRIKAKKLLKNRIPNEATSLLVKHTYFSLTF